MRAALVAGLFEVELSQMLKPAPLGMRLPLPQSREKHKMREPLFQKRRHWIIATFMKSAHAFAAGKVSRRKK